MIFKSIGDVSLLQFMKYPMIEYGVGDKTICYFDHRHNNCLWIAVDIHIIGIDDDF